MCWLEPLTSFLYADWCSNDIWSLLLVPPVADYLSINEDYYAHVEQEHCLPSSIDEDYYARVEQGHSQLSSIDDDYYAHVEQEHSLLSSIDEDYYARVE